MAGLFIIGGVILLFLYLRREPAVCLAGHPIVSQEIAFAQEELGDDAISDEAIRLAVYRKGIQILAARSGFDGPIDYLQVLDDLKKENQERQESFRQGEAVYGITEYTEETYYGQLLKQAELTVQNQYLEKILGCEEELESVYEEYKEILNIPFEQTKYDCGRILLEKTWENYIWDEIGQMEYKGPDWEKP